MKNKNFSTVVFLYGYIFYMFVNASVAVDLSHALDGFQNECMKSDTISK